MIIRVDPPDFAKSSTVQVDSDAPTNTLAMREVDDWAADNGFLRTSEYHLRPILVGGKRQFRGFCYRMTPEEMGAIEFDHQRLIERADKLEVTIDWSKDDR